jgi:hypothetical protein
MRNLPELDETVESKASEAVRDRSEDDAPQVVPVPADDLPTVSSQSAPNDVQPPATSQSTGKKWGKWRRVIPRKYKDYVLMSTITLDLEVNSRRSDQKRVHEQTGQPDIKRDKRFKSSQL